MKNVVLIGMPGCGKSTVGVVLAKELGFDFVDSDIVIQRSQGMTLSQIINEVGIEAFHQIENRANLAMDNENTVIATGGSAVYGIEAMEKYKNEALIIYLKLPYAEIEKRLGDLIERGITLKEGQSLLDLYKERVPIYEEYAHLTLDSFGMTIRDSVIRIKEMVGQLL